MGDGQRGNSQATVNEGSGVVTVGFLITARLKSSRLPKKVMLEVAGKPFISHMLDRVKAAKGIDKIVICTSINPEDDPLAQIAKEENVFCYRGSEDDVLTRLYEAALEYKIDFIVNLTADCPLIDPSHIEGVINAYKRTHADHITANRLPTGQGLWGIDVEALRKVCEIKNETGTEVWGDYFTKSGFFKVHELEVDPLYEHPTLKTSLDYPEDYTFLQRIFRELYVPGNIFSLKDILTLVRKKPEILSINSHCKGLGVQHVSETATPMRLKESGKGYGNSY